MELFAQVADALGHSPYSVSKVLGAEISYASTVIEGSDCYVAPDASALEIESYDLGGID